MWMVTKPLIVENIVLVKKDADTFISSFCLGNFTLKAPPICLISNSPHQAYSVPHF